MKHLAYFGRRPASARIATLAISVVAFGGACSDSTAVKGGSTTQLSFMVGGAAPSADVAAAASSIPITSGGHTLDLQHVELTVLKAHLRRVKGTAPCAGDADDDDQGTAVAASDDCRVVKLGPATVDLPLSGGLVSLDGLPIPAGTYRELEVRIAAIRLKGTFDAKAFDDSIPLRVRAEIDFNPALVVVDGTPVSITVQVPLSNWLVNLDGSLVDPGKLATDPVLLATIRARIRAAFAVFEDRDHDGRDDHKEGKHGG